MDYNTTGRVLWFWRMGPLWFYREFDLAPVGCPAKFKSKHLLSAVVNTCPVLPRSSLYSFKVTWLSLLFPGLFWKGCLVYSTLHVPNPLPFYCNTSVSRYFAKQSFYLSDTCQKMLFCAVRPMIRLQTVPWSFCFCWRKLGTTAWKFYFSDSGSLMRLLSFEPDFSGAVFTALRSRGLDVPWFRPPYLSY